MLFVVTKRTEAANFLVTKGRKKLGFDPNSDPFFCHKCEKIPPKIKASILSRTTLLSIFVKKNV